MDYKFITYNAYHYFLFYFFNPFWDDLSNVLNAICIFANTIFRHCSSDTIFSPDGLSDTTFPI